MRKIFTVLLAVFIVQNIIAQKYPFISKDLHRIEEKELIQHKVQFNGNTPLFDQNGNKINPNQINDIMQSGNFIPVIFGDKNYKVQAIVFRQATKKEKDSINKIQSKQDPNINFRPGIIAPDFNTVDINGNTIKLSKLNNKVIVMNFWFTTCKPCIYEIPELNLIKEKYRNKDVIFIAITFNTKEEIKLFLEENKFNFNIVNDIDILKKYNINNYPTSLIIDKKGKIVFKKIGSYTKALDKTIELLLK